jgi:uncharacterized delta-60 repeat protein
VGSLTGTTTGFTSTFRIFNTGSVQVQYVPYTMEEITETDYVSGSCYNSNNDTMLNYIYGNVNGLNFSLASFWENSADTFTGTNLWSNCSDFYSTASTYGIITGSSTTYGPPLNLPTFTPTPTPTITPTPTVTPTPTTTGTPTPTPICFDDVYVTGGVSGSGLPFFIKYNNISNKLIPYGNFRYLDNTPPFPPNQYNGRAIGELSYDGNVNVSLATGGGFGSDYAYGTTETNDVKIQSDGKIICGGSFNRYSGISCNNIVRLTSGFTFDNTFNIGSGFTFGTSTTGCPVNNIEIQSDGKILVGCSFNRYNGVTVNNFVRLNSDGTLDTAFINNIPTGVTYFDSLNDIKIQSDGKILVAGASYVTGSTIPDGFSLTYTAGLVRFNTDGTVDTTFESNMNKGFRGGTSYSDAPKHLEIQSDGKIICTGYFYSFSTGSTVNQQSILRLNSDGTQDTTFDVTWSTSTFFTYAALVKQIPSTGKILVAGDGAGFMNLSNFIRLNSDGSIDNTFTYYLASTTNPPVFGYNLLPDGKIVLAIGTGGIGIARINANGSSDNC